MMKIGVFGKGRMGSLVGELARQQGHTVTDPLDADVLIDFSHAAVVMDHLHFALLQCKPLVIGTTGWDDSLEEAKTLVQESQGSCLYAPNFSIGMFLFIELARKAGVLFHSYDAALVESHHRLKQDAPSGTAKSIQQAIPQLKQIASVRCGSIPGTHELIFDSADETITIAHTARSRDGFAAGALRAAGWIMGKTGFFQLKDLFEDGI